MHIYISHIPAVLPLASTFNVVTRVDALLHHIHQSMDTLPIHSSTYCDLSSGTFGHHRSNHPDR